MKYTWNESDMQPMFISENITPIGDGNVTAWNFWLKLIDCFK